MRMETEPSLKVHLFTAVSSVTVPQASFLQHGPLKENVGMGMEPNSLLCILNHWTCLNMFVYTITSSMYASNCGCVSLPLA